MSNAKLKSSVSEIEYVTGGTTDWFGPLAMKAWIDTYDAISTAEDVRFVDSILCLRNKSNVMDIGCGHGRHIALLLKQFDLDVVGIDSSTALVHLAKAAVSSNQGRVDIIPVPLENITCCYPKFETAYSLGTSFGYGEYFSLEGWLKSLANMMMVNGLVLLETVLVADWHAQKDVITTHRNQYGNVFVTRTQRYEEIRKRLITNYVYKEGKLEETSERIFKLYSLNEFREAFRNSGFSLEAIYNRRREKIEFGDISSKYSFLVKKTK